MHLKLPNKIFSYLAYTLLPLVFLIYIYTPVSADTTSTTPNHPFISGVQIPSDQELNKLSAANFSVDAVKFQYALGSDQPYEQWIAAAKAQGYKVLLSIAKNETSPKIPNMGKPSETGQWCPWDNELKDVPRDGVRAIPNRLTGEISYEHYTYTVKEASPKGNGYMEFRDQMQALMSKLSKDNLMPDAIEVWNEPNLTAEWTDQGLGPVDPQSYARFMACGIKGAKAGLSAKDKPLFISAALATDAVAGNGNMNDVDFFNKFLAATGNGLTTSPLDSIDAFGWHEDVVYNIPPAEPDPLGFQRVKTALGHGKPVWITEFGWARNQAQITPATQAQYISEAMKLGPTLGDIEAMFIWNFGFGAPQYNHPEFAEWDIDITIEQTCQTGRRSDLTTGSSKPDVVTSPILEDDNKIIKALDSSTLPQGVNASAEDVANQNLSDPKRQVGGSKGVTIDVRAGFVDSLTGILKAGICKLVVINKLTFCSPNLNIGQTEESDDPQNNFVGANTEHFYQQSKALSQASLPSNIVLQPETIDCDLSTVTQNNGTYSVGNNELSGISTYVGTTAGIYGVNLPDFTDKNQIIDQRKEGGNCALGFGGKPFNYDRRVPDIETERDLYYQANFPDGVTPFKEQTCGNVGAPSQ